MNRPARINASEYRPDGDCDPRVDGVRLMVRVAFGQRGALGPGKMRLVELIDQHGSITAACKEMGMSYRRAWLLVEGLKQAFREPVLSTQQGGVAGGGCRLTPYGRSVLKRYRALEYMAREAVRDELRALEQELMPQALNPIDGGAAATTADEKSDEAMAS